MSNSLIKYEAACQALAECKQIDEVKAWTDKAAAMQAYGRMAKDKGLEIDAAEIRIRSERRLGELIVAQKKEGGLNKGNLKVGPVVVTDDHGKIPTLSDAGISKDLSSRAQKLAAVPAAEFEAEVGEWKERVQEEGARVTGRLQKAGERELSKTSSAPIQSSNDEAAMQIEMLQDALAALNEENESLKSQIATMLFVGDEDEKQSYLARLNALTEENKQLKILNNGLIKSRDSAMAENNAMRKQLTLNAKKLRAAA